MEAEMNALASEARQAVVDSCDAVPREFEQQLPDCCRLAFRVAFGALHHREEAEDVAQETVLRAFQNFSRLRDRERLRAWVVRVAWRLSIDRQRAARRRQQHESAAAQSGWLPTVEEKATSGEFERSLHNAMDALPEKLRVALILAGVEGYNAHEVAELLKLPEGTVKSRLHEARKKLAERLKWTASGIATG
jgi:RNA polymerase sigma-70 factor, ECF subfamily